MGSSPSKGNNKDENKIFDDNVKEYFNAYKSIRDIHRDIHNKIAELKKEKEHKTEIVENVYFVKTSTIPNYLQILIDLDILKNIADLTKRKEVRELEEQLKNDFKEYELEENIDYIKIGIEKSKEEFEKEYEEYKNEEFIIVDKDFFERMKMEKKYNPQHKIKLNINEEEIYIELSNEEMIIIIEET